VNTAPINKDLNKLYFRECDRNGETSDSFDRIKLFYKNHPKFYYFLIKYISPVYSSQNLTQTLETIRKENRNSSVLWVPKTITTAWNTISV